MSKDLDLLKQLRDITGAGILDCKKYLERAENNLDEAVKLMRSEEGIKADKKSSRVAAEGGVYFFKSDARGLLIEINSETDFVARSDDFKNFVDSICKIIIKSTYLTYEDLANSSDKNILDEIELTRKNAITKLGENIQIRRYVMKISNQDFNIGYTHNDKIGALVVLKNENITLGKDICMQIVASCPLGLDEQSIDKETLNAEKEIYKKELEKLDKKDDLKRNILEGKVKKFINENTLVNQPFIKDNTTTLKKIIKDNDIIEYVRFQLGEGIEKKNDNFAEEVYSQIK